MKYISLATFALSLFICTFGFAADEAAMSGPMAKITKAPAIETKPAMIAATAYVKAADFAPEGGWSDKDFEAAINSMVVAGSTRVMEYLKIKGIEAAGPMFAIWYEDPSTTPVGQWTSKWGVPIAADNEPTALVSIERMPATEAITCTYAGHPQTAMQAWNDIQKYAESNGFVWAGNPMEVYHSVGEQKPDADGWLVEIVWPAMKKPADAPAAEGEKHD